MKLSVCLATFNEEETIGRCLAAIKNITDEIVIVDGSSTDRTVHIAKTYGARVIITDNPPIFHINKQKAMDACKGDWILQLDADEVVSTALATEIMKITSMEMKEIQLYQEQLQNRTLFLRHQKMIDTNRGIVGDSTGEFVAFYMPRLNYFLGHFMRYGGIYPDGVIRFFMKGKAYLPCKNVHELPVVNGRVGWLQNDLLHYDSPTFKRYLARNSRYINNFAAEFKNQRLPKNAKNFFSYCVVKPITWFFMTQIRNKGVLDGVQGVIFSFFSALRFPRAYIRYLRMV